MSAFYQRMQHKEIAFIGMGVSNNPMIKRFLEHGISVTICDRRSEEQLGSDAITFKEMGASFQLGEGYLELLSQFDILIRSPGVYYHLPALEEARKAGVILTSEMEIFFDLCPCQTIAITGSDGKTTTTALIAEMLKEEGYCVHLGGNIGKALFPLLESIQPDDITVVELSSFQLISMRSSPDIAVITNISPNHLDVHKNMGEYLEAKRHILRHQNAFSKAVLNMDNAATYELRHDIRGESRFFSRKNRPNEGAYLSRLGELCYIHRGEVTPIIEKKYLRLPGMHNVENYLAAIAAVFSLVDRKTIKKVAETFGGVAHRMEPVRNLHGVLWYNDSIATSPTRTIAGLRAFPQKIIVIAGGYDKKIPYEPLAPELIEHAKALILLGATADKIESTVCCCSGYDGTKLPIYRVSSMEEAVDQAYRIAQSGDIVSLSPASASFDMYPNFEARGNHFKTLVSRLK